MTTTEPTTSTRYTGRELRWLADNFEQAQEMRIETGERLRAVLQGRDETFVAEGDYIEKDDERLWLLDGEYLTVEEMLTAIAAGATRGPVPVLGRTYRRYAEEEREMETAFRRALEEHPAWPWLEQVKGVGPRTAGKLLSRLDVTKAPYVSSFWSYCGWATVPGYRYRCGGCGCVVGRAEGKGPPKATDKRQLDGCEGADWQKIAGPEDGVRVAMPTGYTRTDEEGDTYRAYDAYAKKICWQIVTSFVQQGGRTEVPYERFYRRQKQTAEEEKPGWTDGRKDAKAKRKTIKLFLSHLWQVWREAEGMDTPDPWAQAHDGHTQKIEPWEMVE